MHTDLPSFDEEYMELNNHTPLAAQLFWTKYGVDIGSMSLTLVTSAVFGTAVIMACFQEVTMKRIV